jgi:hypothetical protein
MTFDGALCALGCNFCVRVPLTEIRFPSRGWRPATTHLIVAFDVHV